MYKLVIKKKFTYLFPFLFVLFLLYRPEFIQAEQKNLQVLQISKTEPPNWWPVSKTTPLQILFTGQNLQKAKVSTSSKGIIINNTHSSADGQYLFCEINLTPDASVGTNIFEIEKSGKVIQQSWPLLTPLPKEGNFQGLTPSDVIYTIMPDRFADGDVRNNEFFPKKKTYNPKDPKKYHGGDLKGIIQHLDYLKELGVTALLLTPVFDNKDEIGDSYHGYWMTDFYDVEEHFGTLEDYKELVRELHKRGMKLVQDVAPNHTGPHHYWLKNPPTPTWYTDTPKHHLRCTFDIPILLDPHPDPLKRREVIDGWFLGILPDLNGLDQDYARYITQNTIWWIYMTGEDGLRIDTYPYVARSFWPVWQQALNNEFPSLTSVGEVFNESAKVVSFFMGGKTQWDGVDTKLSNLFDFPLMYALRDFCFDNSKDARKMSEAIAKDELYGDATKLVTFIGNHDITRVMYEAHKDARRVKLAFALLCTLRGIPQLYYGDEIGMFGGKDPDNRKDFPGGFRQIPNAFNANERTPEQASIWNEVQQLLKIRREHDALQNGKHTDLVVQEKSWVFLQSNDVEKLLIVVNGSTAANITKIPSSAYLPEGTVLVPLTNTNSTKYTVNSQGIGINLGAFEYQIYKVK